MSFWSDRSGTETLTLVRRRCVQGQTIYLCVLLSRIEKITQLCRASGSRSLHVDCTTSPKALPPRSTVFGYHGLQESGIFSHIPENVTAFAVRRGNFNLDAAELLFTCDLPLDSITRSHYRKRAVIMRWAKESKWGGKAWITWHRNELTNNTRLHRDAVYPALVRDYELQPCQNLRGGSSLGGGGWRSIRT